MNKYVSKKKLNLTWTGSLLRAIKNIYLTNRSIKNAAET